MHYGNVSIRPKRMTTMSISTPSKWAIFKHKCKETFNIFMIALCLTIMLMAMR